MTRRALKGGLPVQAVLSFGSNLGDRHKYIESALGAVGLLPGTRILRTSKSYETAAWGVKDQPDFINACALIETELSPRALLGACLGVEAALGRVRGPRWGPRVIDIDILLIEGFACDSPELTVPHPLIRRREFVLTPLRELFPIGNALGFDLDAAPEK